MIAFAGIVVAFGIWAIYQIITGEIGTFTERTETVTKLGLFVAGVIGLPLAVWKGMLDHRQTREALRQGERVQQQMEYTEKQFKLTERQIAAAEETNLASILERSSALIADNQSEAQKMAGTAFFHYVATAQTETFRFEAIDLLSEFVADRDYDERTIRTAIHYLDEIGKKRGKRIKVKVDVKDKDYPIFYENLTGVTYKNCDFSGKRFNAGGLNYFEECKFARSLISYPLRILRGASFLDCEILHINSSGDAAIEFHNCDFTGCEHIVVTLKPVFSGCYFDLDNPPSDYVLKMFGNNLTGLRDFEIDEFKRPEVFDE
ncbi:hypothetical protein BLM14_09125 [Phyllobacterium zundukense]|nr:hypothetical protein BLM14_09125 [Phyllobacterium zundukense]